MEDKTCWRDIAGRACDEAARMLNDECGQDLIEYALVFSLVALGAVASMQTLGTKIATVFGSIGTVLTTNT